MARKTLSAPVKIVGAASTSTILETATSGDSQTAGTVLWTADGDLQTENVGGIRQTLGPWCKTNITTSLTTATAQALAEVAGMTELAMTRPGSVVGVAACLSANITASTLRVCVSKNGTTFFSAVNAATGVRTITGTQNKGTDTFVAGDRIGIKLVTTATYAPTTLEGVFTVQIED